MLDIENVVARISITNSTIVTSVISIGRGIILCHRLRFTDLTFYFVGNIVNKEFKVKKVFVRNEVVIGNFVGRSRGTEKYHHFTAKLKQKHRSSSNKDMCWHLHKKISGFIDSPKNYQLTSLFHSDSV